MRSDHYTFSFSSIIPFLKNHSTDISAEKDVEECLSSELKIENAHLSTGVEVFSMKLITFSFTLTDFDLSAKVILLTSDLTPLPSVLFSSPCINIRDRLN